MIKRKFAQPSKVSKNYKHDFLQNFLLLFMSLLTLLIIEHRHSLVGIYFIFLKKRHRPNLKCFQYQVWTSLDRSGKQLSSKTNFSAFFCKIVALILG